MDTTTIAMILFLHATKVEFSSAELGKAIEKLYSLFEQEQRRIENEKRRDNSRGPEDKISGE
jgi:hypothetical protein